MARVYNSTVLRSPAEKVWIKIRDFNGMPSWHPRFRDSRIEDARPSDQVGCIRNLSLQNGDLIKEQLLGLSDFDMFITYGIVDSPMPVTNYISNIRLTPITDGDRTFIEWSSEFDCDVSREAVLVNEVGNLVLKTGLDALKRQFGE